MKPQWTKSFHTQVVSLACTVLNKKNFYVSAKSLLGLGHVYQVLSGLNFSHSKVKNPSSLIQLTVQWVSIQSSILSKFRHRWWLLKSAFEPVGPPSLTKTGVTSAAHWSERRSDSIQWSTCMRFFSGLVESPSGIPGYLSTKNQVYIRIMFWINLTSATALYERWNKTLFFTRQWSWWNTSSTAM
jgi:hypothetical protein